MTSGQIVVSTRKAAAIAVLTAIAAIPSLRSLLATILRRLLSKFRTIGRPSVRKNFLEADGHAASSYAVEAAQAANGFADLYSSFPHWLCEGLAQSGFEELKPIQKAVLPLALAGRDVVGIAPTGSGKTLAFLVPALVHAAGQEQPRRMSDGPLALVLAPTRELAIQIGAVAEKLLWAQGGGGRYGDSEGMKSVVLYGGSRRADQLQMLRNMRKVHLMVATPGRLLDFVINFNAFSLRLVSFFVLDEGDRMLDLGFDDDIRQISDEIRKDRQMLFFSATWPPDVEKSAARYCGAGVVPEKVSTQPATDINSEWTISNGGGAALCNGASLPPREITQVIEVVKTPWGEWDGGRGPMQQKLPLLLRHLEDALGGEIGPPKGKALIFVKTRAAAEDLGVAVAHYFGLERCGIMHGQRSQDQREATLKAFRAGRINALVATDVVGRGVDIPDVSHVVIFDFPDELDTYVHRVGRTGRNGSRGTSIAFFEPQPWNPELSHGLCEILRACDQEVPAELASEERKSGFVDETPNPWAKTTYTSGWASVQGQNDEKEGFDDIRGSRGGWAGAA